MSNLAFEIRPQEFGGIGVNIKKANIIAAKYKPMKPIIEIILNSKDKTHDINLSLAKSKILGCYLAGTNEHTEDIYEHIAYCEDNLLTQCILYSAYYIDLKTLKDTGEYGEANMLMDHINKKLAQVKIEGFPKEQMLEALKL